MKKDSKIYIAGHRGMAGSAIWRRLHGAGYENLVGRSHDELDLTRQEAVEAFFSKEKPEYVILAAAKVGGILANDTYPAEFIYSNLAIQTTTIHAAWNAGVRRLLFLGSSCIYPRACPQPIKEEYLLTGPLEKTNHAYSVAKIAGIAQCQSYNRQYGTRFLSVMPTNLYGPGDNFDLNTSHVFPALIRKFHLARLAASGDSAGVQKDEAVFGPIPEDFRHQLSAMGREPAQPKLALWGTGSPYREFLHANDLADACFFLMFLPDGRFDAVISGDIEGASWASDVYPAPLVNIGCGEDRTIRDLASLIANIVGYRGEIVWDKTKPDGTPRKLLDVSKLTALGWKPKISLEDGIRMTYDWYRKKLESAA
jgi:GDP-L-fucose synthase